MNDYNVEPYYKIHLDGIRKLWKEQYSPEQVEKRELLFKWFTEENPFLKDESPYFVVLKNSTVIGLWGHMPVKFSVKGKRFDGYMSQDALLSKNSRGKGIGKIALKEIGAQRDSIAGALWFNAPNFRLYSKCGWLEVPGLYPYIKIIKPYQYFRYKFNNELISRPLAGILKGLNFLKKPKQKIYGIDNYKVIEIESFSEHFDDMFNVASPSFGIVVVRDSNYLNWKFVKKPFNQYLKYAVYDSSGVLCGYMVLKMDNNSLLPKGKILDFFVPTNQPIVFQLLVKHALDIFTHSEAYFVEVLCTLHSFLPLLKRFGFIKDRNPRKFMINNYYSMLSENFVENIQNWFITLSDADGDAWD